MKKKYRSIFIGVAWVLIAVIMVASFSLEMESFFITKSKRANIAERQAITIRQMVLESSEVDADKFFAVLGFKNKGSEAVAMDGRRVGLQVMAWNGQGLCDFDWGVDCRQLVGNLRFVIDDKVTNRNSHIDVRNICGLDANGKPALSTNFDKTWVVLRLHRLAKDSDGVSVRAIVKREDMLKLAIELSRRGEGDLIYSDVNMSDFCEIVKPKGSDGCISKFDVWQFAKFGKLDISQIADAKLNAVSNNATSFLSMRAEAGKFAAYRYKTGSLFISFESLTGDCMVLDEEGLAHVSQLMRANNVVLSFGLQTEGGSDAESGSHYVMVNKKTFSKLFSMLAAQNYVTYTFKGKDFERFVELVGKDVPESLGDNIGVGEANRI